MFLLIFRYVFGGAIDAGPVSLRRLPRARLRRHRRAVRRARARRPASPRTSSRASSTGCARCRSPAARVLAGRALADTGAAGLGARRHHRHRLRRRLPPPRAASPPRLAAFGLCVLFGFAFTWLFITIGLVAGNAQAAQGMSLLVFPLTFVSSAYVPVATMPGWMQAVRPATSRSPPWSTRCARLVLGGTARRRTARHHLPLRDPVAALVGGPGRRLPAHHRRPLPARLIRPRR